MMAFRALAMSALVFLGLSATVGAIPLLRDPNGEPWAMPQRLQQHSPFHSYLIPGVVLLLANGVLSLWVLWLTVRKHPGYRWWVVAQGIVLLAWLTAEVMMLRMLVRPHYVYGGIAVDLIRLKLHWASESA